MRSLRAKASPQGDIRDRNEAEDALAVSSRRGRVRDRGIRLGVDAVRHTPRMEIVRTDDGKWLAICYACGWHSDYYRTYTTAAVDRSSHEWEAKR